jgi:dimethylhistidine N-methyltransferase
MELKIRQIGSSQLNKSRKDKFYKDVIEGLQAVPKKLHPKYLYDAKGDKLFEDLMNCKEYYPAHCEMEIFSKKTTEICQAIIRDGDDFDLIELGAGNAAKSACLLKYLLDKRVDFTYLPIDISENVISCLNLNLSVNLPGLHITGLNGEYFEMLDKATSISHKRKVILFLGANIGNMPITEADSFCEELRRHLSPNDLLIIGFDLKKNPKTVLAAYNDKEGITKQFNLNLLERINRELNGNFDITQFDHFPTYDPDSGVCKSYLVSMSNQHIKINGEIVRFLKDEIIYMEMSQKFTVEQTDKMALNASFKPIKHFFDSKKWYLDAIWIAD